MPRSSTGPVWFLVAVASLLASLVGLVVSSGRPSSGPRSIAPAEPWEARRTKVVLSPPAPPLADETEPPVAPPRTSAPAPRTRVVLERVTGIVLRPEGEAASGARVVLGRQHARCDARGRFELVLAGDEGRADLVAFEPGREPALHPAFGASLGAGGEHVVRLVLGAETLTLSGSVTDADGRPLKGWTVELDGADVLADFRLREDVRTDADGRFELSDVPAGVHVLRAWRDRRELAFRSAPTSAGESGITIVVP